jgi:hypothetical protein
MLWGTGVTASLLIAFEVDIIRAHAHRTHRTQHDNLRNATLFCIFPTPFSFTSSRAEHTNQKRKIERISCK